MTRGPAATRPFSQPVPSNSSKDINQLDLNLNMSHRSACPSRPSNGQVISQPDGFKFTDADSRYGDDYRYRPAPAKQPDPPLGILAVLAGGSFKGSGINMIFRPNNGPPPGTDFHKPVNPPPPHGTSDNVLEINLFEETLSFSKGLGRVPNRGSQKQPDIDLNYLQSVNDVTNPKTGKTRSVNFKE